MNADQVLNNADMWVDPSDNAISKMFDFISALGIIDTLYFNY